MNDEKDKWGHAEVDGKDYYWNISEHERLMNKPPVPVPDDQVKIIERLKGVPMTEMYPDGLHAELHPVHGWQIMTKPVIKP